MMESKEVDFPTLPTEEVENVEKVECKKVEYEELTKEDLVELLKSKDKSIENYNTVLKQTEENHKKEVNNINDYYNARVNELTNLIKYYERKIKLINDLIHIETGDDK